MKGRGEASRGFHFSELLLGCYAKGSWNETTLEYSKQFSCCVSCFKILNFLVHSPVVLKMVGKKKRRNATVPWQGSECGYECKSNIGDSSLLLELNSQRAACGTFRSAACLCAWGLEIRDIRVALMWLPGDVGDVSLAFWFFPWAEPGVQPNR